MSQENVETLRTIYDHHFSEGDFRASVDLFDPHIVFMPFPESPEAEVHLGVEAVAAWMRRTMLETWADLNLEAEEFISAGDSVLVSVRQRGVARISGVPTDAHYFTLWSFRGSKVIRIENFQERVEALEAAGLSE
jgi:ketosteroid isomerase-like protein